MSTKVFSSHYSFISLSPGDLRSRQLLCDSPLVIVNTSTLIFLPLVQLVRDELQQTADDGCDNKRRRQACLFMWTFQGPKGWCATCHATRSEGKVFMAAPDYHTWRVNLRKNSLYPHNHCTANTHICIQMYVYVMGNSNHMNHMTNMLYNKRTNDKTIAFTRTTVSNTKWVK